MRRVLVVVSVVALVLGVMAAPALAVKPLTTITFDELPFQPVDGLSFSGANFAFEIGGVPSNDAYYNACGPGLATFVQCPAMEGNANGTLTITFDKPTTIVEFGVALSTGAALSPGFTVDVIGPNGKSRGVFNVDTAPMATFFTEGWFSYDGPAAKAVVVTFDYTSAGRFALDNLTFHKHPAS